MVEFLPRIIQGGMGAGVSGWRLARAVSGAGQLGVVSGAGLDQLLLRRLQDGDPEGHVRRALDRFPFPGIARRIVDTFFIPGGRPPGQPYLSGGVHSLKRSRLLEELSVAGNFVEVFLAREGHANPVGINYLEKITLPLLPSLYGAMLAGVAVVIVGAGIPLELPGALDAFAALRPAEYPLRVAEASPDRMHRLRFDPGEFARGDLPEGPLTRPRFFPIVASNLLASMMTRRANGGIDGFIVEGHRAGGHNAPARGAAQFLESGEPAYGPRDEVDLERIRALGLPFWLAGSYGSPARLREALDQGAAGIQVGTAFALCSESGLEPTVRRRLIRSILAGELEVFTDPTASPTGFPFKVARLEGTLSEPAIYENRSRVCDLGFLREAYARSNGTIGFRCPAESVPAYASKGGSVEGTEGRRCLCNALLANVGHPQTRSDGVVEPCLLTLGKDLTSIPRYCTADAPDYPAAAVIEDLLGEIPDRVPDATTPTPASSPNSPPAGPRR